MRVITLTAIFIIVAAQFTFSQSEQSPISKAIELRAQHFENASSQKFLLPVELSEERISEIQTEVEKAQYFTLDQEKVGHILHKKPEVLVLEMPLANESEAKIKLYKRRIYADGPIVKAGSQEGQLVENASTSVHYWGKVDGKEKSIVSMSFSSTGIMGMISFDQKTWELGQLIDDANTYILFNVADLKIDLPFECEVSEEHKKVRSRHENMESVVSNPDNCVKVYVEADHDIFLNKGSVTAATNYVEGVFNEVFILYANESVDATISEIFVWDTPSPYSGSGSGDYLDDFRNHLNSNGGYNGDLAHLVNLENYGGVAWLDVLCNSSFGYAYSGINSTYQNVPNYSWSVNVVAHEMGHNVGSPHTHDCEWYGNNSPIDCCGPSAGYAGTGCGSGYSCNMPLPNQGTTMSYCHLISGVGIDLNEGFHPEVALLLQDEVYNSACLSPCSTVPLLAMFSYSASDICAGTSVQFTDESTGNIVSWSWSFPGGTPSSSTAQNPSITYNQAGIFDASLIVTDNVGNTSELVVNDAITVTGIPIADYTYTKNGWDVNFTNLSSQATNYSWDFGDGNTSTLSDPSHSYTQDGIYTVELSAYNVCGADTYLEDITVAIPPQADFTATPNSGCEVLQVAFNGNLSVNANSYYWEFEGGDPAISTDASPTVVYDTDGTYDVFFVASNNYFSDTLSFQDYITVNPLPESSFSHQVNEATVTFTNTSNEYTSLEYDFGDGNSSTSENPVHTYSADDTYTVQLFATNSCGTDTFSTDITITTIPEAGYQASDSMICEQASITFDASLSSNNTNNVIWEFEGGDPATSTQEIETVQYDVPGTFDVTLIAMNANGSDTLTLIDYVTVDPLPVSIFSYFKNNLTVNYYSNPSHHESLLWNFGDGNTSTLENPEHIYANGGTYNVSLIAINDCGNDTMLQTIEVQEALSASFSSQVQSGCPVLEVEFSGSGNTSSSVDYSWYFEGGSPATSTLPDPIVSYDTPGSYDVTLIVSDGNGSDTLLQPDYIFVKELPSGNFSYSVNQRTVSFDLTAMNYTSVLWDFGDGNSSTNEDVEHTYQNDGAYEVIMQLMNECDTITVSEMLAVYTAPQASFQADTSQGCGPLVVQFQNTSSANANSFNWNFEGGSPASSTQENPSVQYLNPGTFNVELIVSSNGGMDTFILEDMVTVLADPTANFDFVIDSNTVSFTNLSIEADSFSWDFGDGNFSSDQDPIHTYLDDGNYTVTLQAFNECNLSEINREIGTGSVPTADFSIVGNTEGCVPFTVQFMNESSLNADSFEWIFIGGSPQFSEEENPVVTYDSTGIYSVELRVSNPVGENMLVKNDLITVFDLPQGDFNYTADSLTVQFNGSVNDAEAEILWDFGDGNTSTDISPTHSYSNDGSYEVLFIVSNDCGADTSLQEILLSTTSTEGDLNSRLLLYPNPSRQFFILENINTGAKVVVMDAYGKVFYTQDANAHFLKVNALGWPAGVYYVQVVQANDRKVFKWILLD